MKFRKIILLIFILLSGCSEGGDIIAPFLLSATPGPNDAGTFTQLTIEISNGDGRQEQLAQEIIKNIKIIKSADKQAITFPTPQLVKVSPGIFNINVDLNSMKNGWYNLLIENLPLDSYEIDGFGALFHFMDKNDKKLSFDFYLGPEKFIKRIWNGKSKYPQELYVDTSSRVNFNCFNKLVMASNNTSIPAKGVSPSQDVSSGEYNSFLLSFPGWNAGNDFTLNFDFNVEGCDLLNRDGSKVFSQQYKYVEAYSIGSDYYWYN